MTFESFWSIALARNCLGRQKRHKAVLIDDALFALLDL